MRMRHFIALLALAVTASGLLAGCSVNEPPAEQTPDVQTHFFQFSNGASYTFSRFSNNSYDTVNYEVRVGTNVNTPSKLWRIDKVSRAPQILYLFTLTS